MQGNDQPLFPATAVAVDSKNGGGRGGDVRYGSQAAAEAGDEDELVRRSTL